MAYLPQGAVPNSNFRPKSSTVPSTQVELRIACRNLLDLDVTSKSDPMCVVYCKDPYSDRYVEIGRTEVVKNTLNPDFVKPIPVIYNFEEHQKLRFDVYDYDYAIGSSLANHDYLGRMECSLGEIVSYQGSQFKRNLTNRQYGNHGTIVVTAEEVGGSKDILVMQFAAVGLDKKDVFGKSDPFLTFSKINEDNSLTVIHKTEVVKNTLNPTWRPMKIPVRTLCNGDLDRTIVIHCYDWDSDGGHDLIGEFTTNARTLMKGERTLENVYECINPKKKAKKRGYKNSGTFNFIHVIISKVKLISYRLEKQYSFLDYIQGGNLLDLDVTSKSDPMCVVYCKDPYSDRYIEVGRTEVIKNTVNPDFVKPIPMSYNFEEHQKLRFDVYDSDYSGVVDLSYHDYLGRMECSLGEIVSSQGRQFKRNLTNKKYGNRGTISVTAEEVGGSKDILVMQIEASGLDKKDVFGKSDPFLTFSKINEDNSVTVVHKTEVVKNTLNPSWRPVRIPVRVLCSGDLDRTIIVHCYDWDSDGDSHDLIGEFRTNARTLMKGATVDNVYQCINPKKKAKKSSYKNSGIVKLIWCKIEIQYSFLDYIQGGTQLHFTVAVDFTASNGDPREPSSLHYQNPSFPSAYNVAIRSVGEIIADYDSDKMFPALGFGARLPPDWRVSHEFFLNGSPNNPYCQGVEGILEAYTQSLHRVQLYGPTNFSPVIRHVSQFASAVRDGSNYFVLLIITDGAITDMPDTKRAIVDASSLPMSIIIVGVGNADFEAMHELDGDSMGLSADGRYAVRDVVQFVAMRDFLNPNAPWEHTKARLAKEVLAEIPNQLVSYMMKHSFMPRNKVAQPVFPGVPPPGHSAPSGPSAPPFFPS